VVLAVLVAPNIHQKAFIQRLAAQGAFFTEEQQVILGTVWFSEVSKVIPFNRIPAVGTKEMLRMPKFSKRSKVLAFDWLLAGMAARAETLVVAVRVIGFAAFF
jgi:hypothetical protein